MHAQHFLPRLESCNTNTELVARYRINLSQVVRWSLSDGQVARYKIHLKVVPKVVRYMDQLNSGGQVIKKAENDKWFKFLIGRFIIRLGFNTILL